MRVLVFLAAVSCCSAHLLPYVLPLTSSPTVHEEGKVVALQTPYLYPHSLATPYAHPYATPYALPYAHPYGYIVKPELKATEFPFVWQVAEAAAEPEAAPAVEEVRRRRRDVEAVKVPLPYIQAVPSVAKTTFETKQLEPIEAATPADTTKLTLTTKEHEVTVPAVKYVQPVVQYKPVTYKVPAPVPLTYSFPHHPFYPTYPAFPYLAPAAPVAKLEE
ncbi:uncharacterized protein LOC123516343 [Portunus trituberculatus]|uniref:uncharacterized protein LOC123516343 n=1 Tax=Portunus trituberculatus TaxID=210409 RepID=UPI001E1D1E74|nr:uncharacterized protein LOC123516343 [Portunus trituberculatus]